jgi:DNA polymerase II small subunit
MDEEILNAIRRRGLLLEKEIYDLLNGFGNPLLATNFLDQLEKVSGQKMITKGVLNKNVNYVKGFVENLPGENKTIIEKVFVRLGISLEVTREKEVVNAAIEPQKTSSQIGYKLNYQDTSNYKKIEVRDFVGHFRSRFQQLQRILMGRAELQNNLVSINKIASDRTNLSLIGIVSEKRITKNKNMILTIEDLTGKIGALIKFDREEVFEKAEEIQLDDVIGIKGSGSKDLVFVHDIFFPDSFLAEKTKFDEDVSIAFLSDMHCGSDRHLPKSIENFLGWINSDDEVAKKIKYIFITGDNVDGVGIFPNQESVLNLKSMNEQYQLLASYLERIPKKVTMFLIPGQHDATRVAEPQPPPIVKYAKPLYDIENLILLPNPAMVKLLEGDKEFKVLMYHGASIHVFINEIKELRLMKAARCPAKAVRHMLKRRHLAPMHGVSPSIVYIPNIDHDPLVISEVPDVLATGDMHRLDIENYNGVLIISGSCWQTQTPFEEKVGNIPDPAKVPVLNLKTRELKIYDFGDESEVKREN